ncbi:MAG: hypothetical protein M0Z98_08840 [Actinomycetales bacterium]|nr:hypothetical protein [Actinomycetales bacterium]
MSRIAGWARGFASFWWDFIIGDDWTLAAGVILAISATVALAHHAIDAWWFLPLAVLTLLALSLTRAARAARKA